MAHIGEIPKKANHWQSLIKALAASWPLACRSSIIPLYPPPPAFASGLSVFREHAKADHEPLVRSIKPKLVQKAHHGSTTPRSRRPYGVLISSLHAGLSEGGADHAIHETFLTL